MKTLPVSEQRKLIITILQTKGRMTTLDARANGIMHPASRVQELRKQGFNIVTNRLDIIDSAGVLHKGVGVYTLDGGKHE